MTGLGINYGDGMHLHNFFTTSTKGNNFYYSMFASLDKEAPPKEVYSKKGRNFFVVLTHHIFTTSFLAARKNVKSAI